MNRLPGPSDCPPLLTDDDIRQRVALMIGPALRDRTLWLFFLDGDRRQAPTVMPVEDVTDLCDDLVDALGHVLEGFLPELATAAGQGSVVLVWERLGPDEVLPDDCVLVEALAMMCRARDLVLRGIYLVTRAATRRLS